MTADFRPICGYISETVIDRGIFTIGLEDESKVVCALSNNAAIDDLEWLRTPVSRPLPQHYSLKANILQTVHPIYSTFGSRVGFPAELRFLGAFEHGLLSRLTLASAGLSCFHFLRSTLNRPLHCFTVITRRSAVQRLVRPMYTTINVLPLKNSRHCGTGSVPTCTQFQHSTRRMKISMGQSRLLYYTAATQWPSIN